MAICKCAVEQASYWQANRYSITGANNSAQTGILCMLFNAASSNNSGGEIRFLPNTSVTRY